MIDANYNFEIDLNKELSKIEEDLSLKKVAPEDETHKIN